MILGLRIWGRPSRNLYWGMIGAACARPGGRDCTHYQIITHSGGTCLPRQVVSPRMQSHHRRELVAELSQNSKTGKRRLSCRALGSVSHAVSAPGLSVASDSAARGALASS